MVSGHSFLLIRQMAALVRRAMAEVCPVPVLLVLTDIIRPMSHLQFCRATLSRDKVAVCNCACCTLRQIAQTNENNQTWLLVTLMVILMKSVYSIKQVHKIS